MHEIVFEIKVKNTSLPGCNCQLAFQFNIDLYFSVYLFHFHIHSSVQPALLPFTQDCTSLIFIQLVCQFVIHSNSVSQSDLQIFQFTNSLYAQFRLAVCDCCGRQAGRQPTIIQLQLPAQRSPVSIKLIRCIQL